MPGHVGARIIGLLAGQPGLEELAERVQRIVPGIALVFDKRGKGGDHGRISGAGAVLNDSRQAAACSKPRSVRNAPISAPGERPVPLAVQFQQEAASIRDGGVGLLGVQHGRPQLGVAFTPDRAESAGVRAHQLALLVHENGVVRAMAESSASQKAGSQTAL